MQPQTLLSPFCILALSIRGGLRLWLVEIVKTVLSHRHSHSVGAARAIVSAYMTVVLRLFPRRRSIGLPTMLRLAEVVSTHRFRSRVLRLIGGALAELLHRDVGRRGASPASSSRRKQVPREAAPGNSGGFASEQHSLSENPHFIGICAAWLVGASLTSIVESVA